ncbi:hypothetical protein TFLX_05094 [Thermoflexales bacterium]|nr:hypothetical protein TFLX_05094 [Thermoflexales bacterium]
MIQPLVSRSKKSTWLSLALLGMLCLFFVVLRWDKLNSLWGDPARWLFEAYRSANGEMLYRDFAWQFPPLSLLLMSGTFRLFGSTFEVAQLVLNVLSLIVVLLLWVVARRMMPARLALAVTLAGVIAIATGGGPDFRFFSLQLYTPAQLTGLIGTLLLAWSLIAALQGGAMTLGGWLALSLGSTIGLLSKPEYAAANMAALIVFGLIDMRVKGANKSIGLWLRRVGLILTLGLLPALIGYLFVSGLVGFDNLFAGVTGYGAAALICPWWPTGLGLLGALAALGQGVLFVMVLSLVRFNSLRRRYGGRYLALWLAAGLGLVLNVVYLPAWLRLNNVGLGGWEALGFVTTLGVWLLPVMWCAIGTWFILLGSYIRTWFKRQAFSSEGSWWWVLLTIGVALSARSLFGDSHSITTMVPVAAMPIWLLVGVSGLIAILRRFKTADADEGQALWAKLVLVLVILFAGLRLIYGLGDEARTTYTALDTLAGRVRLADRASAAIYADVLRETQPTDQVLDVAYGGGINFAARRASPTFSTQWWYLLPAQKYVDQDLAQFIQQPPRLVIANDLADYGAAFGVISPTRCPFPRLVWQPDQLAYDPMRRFAVIDYINANYQSVVAYEGMVVLMPVNLNP